MPCCTVIFKFGGILRGTFFPVNKIGYKQNMSNFSIKGATLYETGCKGNKFFQILVVMLCYFEI